MQKVFFDIPLMSEEQVCMYYRKIKPIVRINELVYYLHEYSPKYLMEESYILTKNEDKTDEVNMDQLEVIMNNKTYHKYKYSKVFAPTIAEIISQIPKELLEKVVAFEILLESEKLFEYTLNKKEFLSGYLSFNVRLYSKKN